MTIGHYIWRVRRKIHREDILKAGLDLMFENGYSATGIKEITNRVSIPKGSFYNHFNNKEEFGLEVVQNYCDNGLKMYQKRFLDTTLSPLARVETFFDVLIQSYSNQMDYKLGCVMGNFSTEMSDVNENFRELLDVEFDKLQDVIEQCLKEAVELGEISKDKNTNTLASFLLNSWHGAMLRMKTTANSKPLEDCKSMVMSLLKS